MSSIKYIQCGNCEPGDYRIFNGRTIIPDANDQISYGFFNFSKHLSQAAQQSIFAKAFYCWGRHISVDFVESKVERAQVKIGFYPLNHKNEVGCPFQFDGKSGTLAHAFYPQDSSLDGHIHFDEDERFSDRHNSRTGEIDLLTIAIHEIGHAMGLGHSEVAEAVMFPTYSGERRTLHEDDISGIHQLHKPTRENPSLGKCDVAIRVLENSIGTIRELKETIMKSSCSQPNASSDNFFDFCLPCTGVAEVPGLPYNEKIMRWIRSFFPDAKADEEIAWCSIYLISKAKEFGLDVSNATPAAKSFKGVGTRVYDFETDQFGEIKNLIRKGDIAVFDRGRKGSWQGHNGVIGAVTIDNKLLVNSGNDNNQVTTRIYDIERLEYIVRPEKIPAI